MNCRRCNPEYHIGLKTGLGEEIEGEGMTERSLPKENQGKEIVLDVSVMGEAERRREGVRDWVTLGRTPSHSKQMP